MTDFNEIETKNYIQEKYINNELDKNIFSDQILKKIFIITNGSKEKIDVFCKQYLKDPISTINEINIQKNSNNFFSLFKNYKVFCVLSIVILLVVYQSFLADHNDENKKVVFKIDLPEESKNNISIDKDLLIALQEINESEIQEEIEVSTINDYVNNSEIITESQDDNITGIEILSIPEDNINIETKGVASVATTNEIKNDNIEVVEEKNKDIDWLMSQSSDKYVLQLISAIKTETITNYLKYFDNNDEIIELSANIKGKNYHILVYGLFDSSDLARAEISKLPEKARQIKPWVRTVGSIKELIQ